jgi:hypothetical protein
VNRPHFPQLHTHTKVRAYGGDEGLFRIRFFDDSEEFGSSPLVVRNTCIAFCDFEHGSSGVRIIHAFSAHISFVSARQPIVVFVGSEAYGCKSDLEQAARHWVGGAGRQVTSRKRNHERP